MSEVVVYKEIFIHGVYDLSLLTYYPEVILDWGGHFGFFSLLAKSKFPESKLSIYEPNPQNLKRLNWHFEINRVNADVSDKAVLNHLIPKQILFI